MNTPDSETMTLSLRSDPLSLACLAGVGVSILLMSLTALLA